MQVKVFEADDMNSGLKLIKEEMGPDALIISTKTIRGNRFGLGGTRLEITAAIDNAVAPVTRREYDMHGRELAPNRYETAAYNNGYSDNETFNSYAQQDRAELFPPQNISPSLGNPYLHNARRHTDASKTPWGERQERRSIKTSISPTQNTEARMGARAFSKPHQAKDASVTLASPAHHAPRHHDAFAQQVSPMQTSSSHTQAATAFAPITNAMDSRMQREMEELKHLVRNLVGEVARLQPMTGVQTASDTPLNANQATEQDLVQNSIQSILEEKGLNTDISVSLSEYLTKNIEEHERNNTYLICQKACRSIEGMLDISPILERIDRKQQRIAFVGATGVGKTTTLAKVAASRLSYGEKIALITIDTYRIAAVEQIKVYGEIMNLPVDVVITPQQLENAILKHHDCDLILIDTAGRSPKDELSIDELSCFLRPDLHIENHLVLSASTREDESIDTINRFQKLGIHSTIFTKLDECSQLGSLLNVQLQNNTPISCLTNGQRVPEDLVDISARHIASLIMAA